MLNNKYDYSKEYKIQIRRDDITTWNARNPVLLDGEIAYDITNKKIKIGNGINSWSNLSYLFEGQLTADLELLLNQHINNFNNPHNVNSEQIQDGLDLTLFFESNLT